MDSDPDHDTPTVVDNVGTQDMTILSNLTVQGINNNLKLRYDNDLVYTYTGTILISVNPYKPLNIYGTSHVRVYHNTDCSTQPPPHIYAIAEQAYNSLIRSYDESQNRTTNQSIVISGESGAGKTETTKFILQYLCHVTSNVSTWVENQILEANTILEAFGNAKTVRNDNSSRFGKFMQVCFDSKWMIKGCIIQDYLLEQSRITFQSKGERNYHVFYQLIAAAKTSREISEMYALNQHGVKGTVFNYLQNQQDITQSLDPLLLALQILQIPNNQVTGLFSTLSAILHLGNLQFTPNTDGETAMLTDTDKSVIQTISKLLQVNEQEFTNVLLTRQINVRGNVTEIPLRVNEASENRHAMSKALYSRCFGWLISHINERTNPGQDCSKVIGLLDIFGFENFEVNSFEQLCINYANEKLHKFFNQAVFQIEQEIYKSEGLNISEITFTDNNQILELIEKPPRCILKLLTEQCHLPKGSDLGFLNNLHSEFDTHHPCYEKGDDRRNWDKRFTIKHYAGNVLYTVNGFVDKNRDVQQDLFFNTLGESSHEFIRNISNLVFEERIASATIPRNTSKGRPTVAETFRGQLQQLVEVLGNTKAWYVRCIKPNDLKTPGNYNVALVEEQLKYLGMLEIIRIRKDGYPVHMGFDEFSKRYKLIGAFRTYRGAKDTAQHVLETLNPELPPPPARIAAASNKSTTYLKQPSLPPYYYQLGNTRAFLKPQMHELLESRRSAVITKHVLRIQSYYKAYKCSKSYNKTRSACLTIQRAYRSWNLRLIFLKKRRAAITIQCYLRGFFAREVACALREMRRVEEELRKREIEAEKKRNSVNELSSDDGRESRSLTSDEEVVGGTKDVSLDNLFEFLLVNSGKEHNANELDKLSYEMDNLVNDLNGLNNSVTNSNSICSSMSNFEDNEGEFDADNDSMSEYKQSSEERSTVNTPTNEKFVLPPPPPSPPPLIPPPENLPSVAKVVPNHNRLPEPTEKPPPPPVFANSTTQKKVVQKVSHNDEPIYEAIQPRNIPEPLPPVVIPPPPREQIYQKFSNNGFGEPNVYRKVQPIIEPVRNIVQPQLQAPPQVQHPLPSRVEKRVQEIMQTTTQPQPQDPEAICTFKQYAFQYFSLENRKSSQSEEEYVVEHTSYTKNSHINHPHVHLYDPSNIQVSCFMFRDLNKLMKGELKPETEIQALQTVIGYGIEREELRDEIYVQVLRQINLNPVHEYLERLYLVFCLAIVSFPPGKILSRVISNNLAIQTTTNQKLASQVKWILDNLQDLKIRGYVRKLPPSSVEIQAMKRLGTIVCRFFFLDGRTKAIDIHPTDTALDAIIKLGEKIGVATPQSLVDNGWAVYQVRPNERVEEHVPAHTYVYDVIAHWELANIDKTNGVSLGCGDNRFVFKKRLFKGNCREIPQDTVECALLYAQAVFCVVKRDDFPVAEKVSLQLAGLQSQVLLGEPPTTQKSFDNYTNVEAYLPVRIARSRPHQQWVPILAQAHRTYGAGKSELVARVWYLSCVMQYPLYGTTMFHVVYRGYWVYGNSLVLGISGDGISMIKSDDKFIMYEYAYNQIESVTIEPSEKLLTINLNRSLPPDTHKCFVFETNHTSEIGALISSYCPALSNKNELNKPNSNVHQLTNQDRMRLYGNVLNARKSLIESGLLKKPERTLAGVNFLKNTLRRVRKHKLERTRQYALMNEEQSQDYPNEFFCYSKHAISQSITNLTLELEPTAVWMFNQLLSFSSGQTQNSPVKGEGGNNDVASANLLQAVFEKIWRSDPLINEFYLILIKQTSDHPEPNSRVNARNWGALSLVCSVIAPPDTCVRKYLNAHLKRCAITDFVTEEGKYARFAEKCLQHTITSNSITPTARRQWPPGKNEIICTINRKPITARFHFMDGKYHTLQFAPNDTASDLIVSLTTKIGLPQGVKGYAIYEVSTSAPQTTQSQNQTASNSPWERSLTPQEKPVEVIARWERQKSTTNSNPVFKFMIRKHLYESLDLSNPIEKELVYHQLLGLARNDRFPVSDTEAAMLVALQAQVELGDYASSSAGEFPDYCHVSAHCLPTRIAALVSHEAVARHHQSLVGTPGSQAKQTVLNLLMSWPLFKCIVFDVTQSFTSNWPRNLWLALDNTGLHLLPQRTRHTLCTFEYSVIKSYSPSPTCFMIVTRTNDSAHGNSNKIVLTTNQAYQIAQLIKEFVFSRVNGINGA
ncbi:unnamed protein product [Orchesella dallaii]|uniref:Myosin-VIIa n=1 Tax=Orchesella dallaii TaxID=48710 RepID=A0ABP1QAH7_9HEXA